LRSQTVEIRYEQAVYGSFPFWDKGYAVLAESPGCRPEWLAGLRAACQRFGERPGGVDRVRSLFAMRLVGGPWMIVGVGSPGNDDRGRPGALAFHALFVSQDDYRRTGCNPFAFEEALRDDWTAATRHLPPGTFAVAPEESPTEPTDPRTARVVGALVRGRRVAIEATGPIEALARQVWPALPGRVRRRASVATWAFGNGNRFDLVALPRLAGVERDASYLDPTALEGEEETPTRPGIMTRGLVRGLAIAGALAALVGAILGLLWHPGNVSARARPDPTRVVSAFENRPAPDRAAYSDSHVDADGQRQVAEELRSLAERFGVDARSARQDDPAALMVLLADQLRYRGPSLSAAEQARLATDPDRSAALALRWHAQVRRFADDRPLPIGFETGPLRWQLDTLAWSFHLDRDPSGGRRSDAEVPLALGEELAVDLPPSSNDLSMRHPTLTAYYHFLRRLPRR
jgi:hypothetical protein